MHAAQVMKLSQLLAQTAKLYPARAGVIRGESVWTWREIDERVNALCQALTDLGVVKGDRILTQSCNCLQTLELAWVAFRLGCV